MKCKICGAEDLLMTCGVSKVCSVCTVKFCHLGSPTDEQIDHVRNALGLGEGEYLKQDVGAEAAKILRRIRK
jgi:hypothetical protein